MNVWTAAKYGNATRHTATINGHPVSIIERPVGTTVRCTRTNDTGTGCYSFNAVSVERGKEQLATWAQSIAFGRVG